jgi:hypothetical protein
MMRWLLAPLFVLALVPRVNAGQPPPPILETDCGRLLDLLSKATDPSERQRIATRLVEMNIHPTCLAEGLIANADQREHFGPFLKQLEVLRTDKQAGSSAGSGGSTNLVSKGTTAKVLSFAAEYGALTQSVNKQIVTVQGSLDGVPAALVRHNLVRYCPSSKTPDCVHRKTVENLKRFSYAVSFDTSQSAHGVTGTSTAAATGSAQPVTFSADGHSITAVTVRGVVLNARDTVSKTYQQAWTKAVKEPAKNKTLNAAANALLREVSGLVTTVEADANYQPWQLETVKQILGAKDEMAMRAVWTERQRVLAELLRPAHPEFLARAEEFSKTLSVYRFEQDAVIEALQKPALTLQYDYNRPNDQPVTHVGRLILDKGFKKVWSFAINGAVEMYGGTLPADVPGTGRVRAAQFGAQIQHDLGTLTLLGAAAVSGTYYFQYQNSPAVLNVTASAPFDGITFVALPSTAKKVFAEKGHLHVAQLRLVLGPGQSSARFPISISYSNRTELIDKPAWRGQIGVSYDFDSLFSK